MYNWVGQRCSSGTAYAYGSGRRSGGGKAALHAPVLMHPRGALKLQPDLGGVDGYGQQLRQQTMQAV